MRRIDLGDGGNFIVRQSYPRVFCDDVDIAGSSSGCFLLGECAQVLHDVRRRLYVGDSFDGFCVVHTVFVVQP